MSVALIAFHLEDFRHFFANQASLLKFLAHCCTQRFARFAAASF